MTAVELAVEAPIASVTEPLGAMIEGIAGGAETAPDDAILENYLDSYDWYGTQSADTDSSAAYAGYHSNPDWSDSDDGHVDDDFSIYSGGSSDSGG